MDSLVRAFESLFDRLPAVAWPPLALALVLHVARTAARSRAWRNVLAAAYPGEDVRWRSVFAGGGSKSGGATDAGSVRSPTCGSRTRNQGVPR